MKFLKHNRDTVGDFQQRVLIHIPLGFASAFSCLVHWSLPLILAYIFQFYERNEDAHTSDEAWKDVYGWMAGALIGTALIAAYKLWMWFK